MRYFHWSCRSCTWQSPKFSEQNSNEGIRWRGHFLVKHLCAGREADLVTQNPLGQPKSVGFVSRPFLTDTAK